MAIRIIELLGQIPLFDSLTPEELREIEPRVKIVQVPASTILFREGDPGGYVCFVIQGSLEVLKEGGGGQVALAKLTRGRSIGEMSIIDRATRSATVRALENSQLAVLSRGDFDTLLESHPVIGIKILKSLARLLSLNLRRTSSHLADLLVPADAT